VLAVVDICPASFPSLLRFFVRTPPPAPSVNDRPLPPSPLLPPPPPPLLPPPPPLPPPFSSPESFIPAFWIALSVIPVLTIRRLFATLPFRLCAVTALSAATAPLLFFFASPADIVCGAPTLDAGTRLFFLAARCRAASAFWRACAVAKSLARVSARRFCASAASCALMLRISSAGSASTTIERLCFSRSARNCAVRTTPRHTVCRCCLKATHKSFTASSLTCVTL
jgi:hypothetical protein